MAWLYECYYCHEILIHTSVKLVTPILISRRIYNLILIHTSVKLVTPEPYAMAKYRAILIHTSVKLVTDGTGYSVTYWRF